MRSFVNPAKVKPGDGISVISPSSGLPAIFPLPHELGLKRLARDFDLTPVEYPTTRIMGAAPADRAADIHAAFTDERTSAVIATIGGSDQLKVLRHLDIDLIRAHPKPFFGLSDNTNLINFLWTAGIVSFHGATVMTALGRGGAMHSLTELSLRAALFSAGTYELTASTDYRDVDFDWRDPKNLQTEPPMAASEGWRWHGPSRKISGVLWGGNLEILFWNLAADRILDNEAYAGCVFYLETSEEMPSALEVERMLMCFGERGLLRQFSAILVGRPKAWSLERQNSLEEKAAYVAEQEATVLAAVAEYELDVPVVTGLDIGHTDPVLTLPNGGLVTVDAVEQRIFVEY
ncbi:S66 family peptidase [Fodinicola acaciae]|uniref:S66 family peptidase n=1 Tax=Fodinicola acaciae TaxID=2681555 RepID=UPI0013D54862|nr:S66 peptidase family protein [Fodinicola acaciae]